MLKLLLLDAPHRKEWPNRLCPVPDHLLDSHCWGIPCQRGLLETVDRPMKLEADQAVLIETTGKVSMASEVIMWELRECKVQRENSRVHISKASSGVLHCSNAEQSTQSAIGKAI